MAMAMAPKPKPTRQRVVEGQLEELLNQRHRIPLALGVSGSLIPIKDLSPSIEEFREQKAILERTGSATWPSVLVTFRQRPELGKRWIPLDLRDGFRQNEPKDSVERRLRSHEIQQNIIMEVRHANLDAHPISREEVTQNFRDVLSDIITGRASHPVHREDGDPPSEEFTVITDEQSQQILFATGYFISTKQGFGISTPATRRLEWGPYIFGINKSGRAVFSDTLWTVPDVLSIRLSV